MGIRQLLSAVVTWVANPKVSRFSDDVRFAQPGVRATDPSLLPSPTAAVDHGLPQTVISDDPLEPSTVTHEVASPFQPADPSPAPLPFALDAPHTRDMLPERAVPSVLELAPQLPERWTPPSGSSSVIQRAGIGGGTYPEG